jgi:hypothetical protein
VSCQVLLTVSRENVMRIEEPHVAVAALSCLLVSTEHQREMIAMGQTQ